ncbi:DNA gyrase inhibitor YacG [Chondromyces apiculatus]|uniref:Uncharacterized protein n=1 Tax=Chondromyces apiculatus DSM 436 TaxID=1192034 RepID=A0A017SZI0_9BACT|nr:Hypothetical protein CAP_7149 [Chondromyces apiculatus DSM 436]
MEVRSTSRCSQCGKPAAPPAENPAFPFCSPQCKLLDLGRWLDGSYRIPGPAVDPGESSRSEEDET